MRMVELVEVTGIGELLIRALGLMRRDVQVELAGGSGCNAPKCPGIGGKRQRHLRKFVNWLCPYNADLSNKDG
jgi:hypothetical protein